MNGRGKGLSVVKEQEVIRMLERGIEDADTLSGYSGLNPDLCRVIRSRYRRKNGLPRYKPKPKNIFPDRCKTCYYRRNLSSSPHDYFCDYIGVEHVQRGCPGGDECIRYLSRKEARERGKV